MLSLNSRGHGKGVSTVRVHDLVVVERSSFRGEEKDCRAHVRVLALATGGVARARVQLGLLVLVALLCRHLRGEDARGDAVDAHRRLCEGGGEHAGDVGEGGL